MLLYLLERNPPVGRETIEIGGGTWGLVEYNLDTVDLQDVPFICLSYTWGLKREPSLLHPGAYISDRTGPALAAIIAHRPSDERIWVDGYCVPIETAERHLTLQSMGYIYSCAKEVVTVLSSATYPILQHMSVSDRLNSDHLVVLEKEGWVTRAWTYQEAVNSRSFSITCEGLNTAIVDGTHFLNCLGFTLSRFVGPEAVREKRRLYPHLDAFEDLIADSIIAAYQERSALQVMSQMDRRCHHLPEDHFYAMMGAITTVCCSFDTEDPCEAFMSMCEEKGDYSFIYSKVERDTLPTRRWRPVCASRLPPVFAWNWYGDGQPGHKVSGSLYLDEVVVLRRGPVGESGEDFLKAKLEASKMMPQQSSDLGVASYAALESMGFIGSSQGISTEHGFFFPSESVGTNDDITILVATKVQCNLGSPGLIQPGGSIRTYIPGVFCGRVNQRDVTTVKML
ncbi:hypothetical protein F5X97DRAFT_310086 [Nemania serpens]|nr:hypothetical protein F5X97DRAFT_310086 [Nemania serpens]